MLDSKDIRIIEQLKENSRASFYEIADELEIAPSTVSSRVGRPILDGEVNLEQTIKGS